MNNGRHMVFEDPSERKNEICYVWQCIVSGVAELQCTATWRRILTKIKSKNQNRTNQLEYLNVLKSCSLNFSLFLGHSGGQVQYQVITASKRYDRVKKTNTYSLSFILLQDVMAIPAILYITCTHLRIVLSVKLV